MSIPFNIPYLNGQELLYIKSALRSGRHGSDGEYILRCKQWFESNLPTQAAFMTHTCSHALEMAALICDIKPNDEVIIPSFTHVSTANAFSLRGATSVFADVEPATMTMCIDDIAKKITARTRMIVVVHYGGYTTDLFRLKHLCDKHNLILVEDAAHGIGGFYQRQALGTIGHLGCISFHETKNIQCGEGGVLLLNDASLLPVAEEIYNKGTDRAAFLKGSKPYYQWTRLGSSFAMDNIRAAMLFSQLHELDLVTEKRRSLWMRYYKELSAISSARSGFSLPPYPEDPEGFNAHIFYVMGKDAVFTRKMWERLNGAGIQASFHYTALHESTFGSELSVCDCPVASERSKRLLRLPLFNNLNQRQIQHIAEVIKKSVSSQ